MNIEPEITFTPAVANTAEYSVPRPLTPVDVCLDSNEGSFDRSIVKQALAKLSDSGLNRYPKKAELEAQIASLLNADAEQVLVTAGGDEAIDRACRAVLSPGRELIFPEPSFEMYQRDAALCGAEVVSVPWSDEAFPTDAILQQLRPETAAIAIVSPNNPTGAVASREDLTRISQAAPQALLIVDLAYVEFADEDLSGSILQLPNAVGIRTLSKAWGLAGLRVGYAFGSRAIINRLRAAGAPYPVSELSLAVASQQLLSGKQFLRSLVTQVRTERTRLAELLSRFGASLTRSQGNFVFGRVSDSKWLCEALAGLGFGIRVFPGKPFLENALRISCPGEETVFQRLCQAIRTVYSPEAILFDMDGVLADVSESYRAAIQQTAQAFGADVSFEAIAAVKARGNANNDWEVTARILKEDGKNIAFEKVKEDFENRYQGRNGFSGLWKTEQLLPSKELLKTLAARLPLAIVTGRPRQDAERFLSSQGIEKYFSAIICMEDAPLKPSPAPVQLALEQLGIERAWMIGDTPDDIVSARKANVLPLGVCAPGDQSAQRLLLAGSARVLTNIEELLELL